MSTAPPQEDVTIDQAVAFARQYVHAAGGPAGKCWPAAWNVRDRTGLALVEGTYLTDHGPVHHTWNVTPSGTIVDATAGQFHGDPHPRVVAIDHPDRHRYRPRRTP